MFSSLYHYQDFYRAWLYIWVTRRVSYKKQELLSLREHMSPPSVGVRVAHLSNLCVCCSIMCLYVLIFVLWCPLRFPHTMMFVSSLSPVVCRRTHVLFTLFVFVCALWYPAHIVLCFCFVCLRLVYSMLPVSLDCPFLIAPSVFSNVHLQCLCSSFSVV
jgi:hypothetical protein